MALIHHPTFPQRMGDNVIWSISPLLHFFRSENKKVLGHPDIPQKTPQLYHFSSPASFGTKGTILYDDEIEIRIGSSRTACMGTKQNNHPGMHGRNYSLRYVIKKSIRDRNHRLYLKRCNVYPLGKG
jgi:hypothetical protein